MKSKIILLAMVGFLPLMAGEMPEEFNGRSGESLRGAVARMAAPKQRPAVDANCLDILGGSAAAEFFDPFSGTRVKRSADIAFDGIVPLEYWSVAPNREEATADLYNHIPFTSEVSRRRKDRIPGVVEKVEWDGGLWRTGRGRISGYDVDFYEPPRGFEGDFARTMFYMAAVYPTDSWTSRAYMLFDGSNYPALTPYGIRILLSYHRADPVDERELQRSRAVGALQGNCNPFVEYPELAEYLWGEKKDETVVIPEKPAPLRGNYNMADGRVDLVSPYVPDDAQWTVDGKAVTATSLSTASLGAGKHELRYYSPSTGTAGMLTIMINE